MTFPQGAPGRGLFGPIAKVDGAVQPRSVSFAPGWQIGWI